MFKKVLLMTKLILLFALSTSWAVAPESSEKYYCAHSLVRTSNVLNSNNYFNRLDELNAVVCERQNHVDQYFCKFIV